MEEILSISDDDKNKDINTLDAPVENSSLDLNTGSSPLDDMLELSLNDTIKPKKSWFSWLFKKKEIVVQDEQLAIQDEGKFWDVSETVQYDQIMAAQNEQELAIQDEVVVHNAFEVQGEQEQSIQEEQNTDQISVQAEIPENNTMSDMIPEIEENLLNTDISPLDDILELSWSEAMAPKKSWGLFGFLKKKEKAGQELSIQNDSVPKDDLIVNETISLDESISNADIFQELELGSLNFWEQNQNEIKKPPFEPLVFVLKLTSMIFWLVLFWFIGFFITIFAKSTDSDFVAKMPLICDYIGSSIDWYDNSDCKTLNQIIEWLKKDKSNIETNLTQELSILIPEKIKTNYILSSPKVKFIQEKTWNARISIARVLEDFEYIRKNSWGYQWKNIECSQFDINEKWDLNVSCDFYGASINESENTEQSMSSRWVALDFLKNLQSKNSSFTIADYPSNIEISKFNWWEDIKVIFSTKTSLGLRLKYYPLSTKL
ncbi:MAG: hypothetical protein ACD_3C00043G0001 [uncultured bacterium (gcode 4)]|uniref:Uncharacterized protein n=1 Tax=uncultured bacterium (gcode 4) TaxID=1234023 RepID=K2G2S0_9BACT|nr:MAG: hypothetical protein ACD_3C00043G0001 [uncultured bacterium (gcode 4)]